MGYFNCYMMGLYGNEWKDKRKPGIIFSEHIQRVPSDLFCDFHLFFCELVYFLKTEQIYFYIRTNRWFIVLQEL